MGHAVDLCPARAANSPWPGAQRHLGFEAAVPATPAPPSSGAGPAGGKEAVELSRADFFEKQAVGGGDRAVGFFPAGQTVAQNRAQALAAGLFAGLPEGFDDGQEGFVDGWAAPSQDGSGGRLTGDRKTASKNFDEIFAPQSGDAHAFIQQAVPGFAARAARVSGLLNLKVFPDAGLTHGWRHAHGVILFESMRGGEPPIHVPLSDDSVT